MLDLLQSIFAFVLTLLGMATLVTVIIEMFGRFTRRRGRVLRHIVELVIRDEIRPLVAAKLGTTSDAVTAAVREVMTSPIKPAVSDGRLFRPLAWLMSVGFGADSSSTLTAHDLLVRLSRTEIGAQLYEASKDEWENTVKLIEERYEELCAAASEWFRNSTAIASLLIGVLLAFGMNFDGYRVLEFYLRNPSEANAVTERAAEYLASYDDARKRLDQAIEALGADAPQSADARSDAKRSLDELAATYRAIENRQRGPVAAGLPAGQAYFPYCGVLAGKKSADPECLGAEGIGFVIKLLPWAVSALISGILIGLGGPFWYNMAAGLLRVTQMMRGRTLPPGEAAATASAPAGATTSTSDVLRRAYERHAPASGGGGPPAEQ